MSFYVLVQRQMEVYRLEPNTTYEFRLWANNQLGSGEMVTTNVTTLSETKEEGIRIHKPIHIHIHIQKGHKPFAVYLPVIRFNTPYSTGSG